MSRYIDVDKLSEMIEARAETLVEGKEAFYYIANWLNKLPPTDVVEIRQGKWKDEEFPKCVYEYDGETMEYCVQGPCPNFKTVEQIRAEAIKEFAERLKKPISKCRLTAITEKEICPPGSELWEFWNAQEVEAELMLKSIDRIEKELTEEEE